MTLMLNLTPELEQQIRNAANSVGEDVESFVLQAVQARLGDGAVSNGSIEDNAAWRKLFDAWLASRRPVEHFVDDSRESIYEGRGE